MKAGWYVVLFCLFGVAVARAQPVAPGVRFEIRDSYETSEQRGADSTGSSHGHSTLIERVVVVRDGGVELVYDQPESDKQRQWQFPVRVFKPASGPFELLNAAELEARVDPWLTKAKWTREICGRWIFTWNAFKIDCDPRTALDIVEGYSLWPDDLRDGAAFHMKGLLGTPPIKLERSDASGSIYSVTGAFDPEALKQASAESDVVVAQIVGKPLTQEQALAKLAGEQFAGSIEIRFTVDSSGLVLERSEQSEFRTVTASGEVETRTRKSTLKRRRLP